MPAPSPGRGRRVSDTGGLTSVTFTCKKCAFSTHSYGSGWRKHLLEDGHQTEARLAVKHFPTKVKKRAVVVFGISSVKVKAVLKYLGDFATVTDFIFWTERPDFCIATVLHPPSRDFLLRDSHAVNEKRILLRALDEILEAEWVSICPFASVNVKMEKEEDEDSPVDVFRESSEEEDECPPDDVDPNNETQSFSTFSSFNNENSSSNNRRKSLGLSFSTSIFSSDAVGGTTNNDEIGGSSSSDRAVPLSTAIKREREERVKQDKRGDDDEDSDGIIIIEDDDDMEPCADQTINHNQLSHGLQNGLPIFDLPFVRDADSGTGSMDTSSKETDVDSALNEVLERFYNESQMDPSRWNLRSRIVRELTLLLQNDFPNCILVPFGIVSSGITIPSGLAQAPLNLFVDVKRATECTEAGRVITMDVDTAARDERVQKVYARLQQCQSSHSSIRNLKIVEDKVGFFYVAAGQQRVNCWIHTSNFPAVQCSRLANFCYDLDDRVRPLQMIFRHWAFHHKLTKSNNGHFNPGDYSFRSADLQWLPIHFLIHKNILPSVELLKTTAPVSLLYGGENIAFCNDLTRLAWTKKSNFPRNPVNGNPSAKCILQLATELFDHCVALAELKSKGVTGIISISLGDVLYSDQLKVNNPFSSRASKQHTIALSLLEKEAEIILQHPFKLFINMTNDVKTVAPLIIESTHTADCLRKLLNGDRQIDDPITALALRAPPTYKAFRPQRVNVFLPVPANENGHHEDESEEPPASPPPNNAEEDQDETTTNGDNNTAPGSAIRKNKIRSFEIQLNLSDDMKGLKLNDDVINQLRERWSEIFARFNHAIWPVCFGVNLWTLDDSHEDPNPTPPWATILEPYMGLIKSSETLKSFSLPAKDFKKELTKVWINEVSRKLWNVKPPPPSRIVMRDDMLQLKKRKFSFQCRHIGHSGKATTLKPIGAIIRLQFTEIFYEDKKTSKNLKNNIVSVYEKLWKEYVRMQILQWTKKSPPKGTPQNCPTRRQRQS